MESGAVFCVFNTKFSILFITLNDGGYSAFSIFSNTCGCYRKNYCTRDFGSPQNLSRLCGCVAEPPSAVLITISYQSKRAHHKGMLFCFGGRWWIRTTEGIASRFTVCPLWPLGKSPILNFALMELVDGLEPPTC